MTGSSTATLFSMSRRGAPSVARWPELGRCPLAARWLVLQRDLARSPRTIDAYAGKPWYPLELVRAVALLWLFAGLRVDEILRLRVGVHPLAARTPRCREHGELAGLLCSTSRRTRPGPRSPSRSTRSSATRSRHGRHVRPPSRSSSGPQDRRAGRLPVRLPRRAARRSKYVNQDLIPLLCRKAGVPREDVRGQITGHRARATIASQLYNAKDPMTLFELQAWLGHRSPASTQHYARITPITLTKAYTDAGYFARNVRAIEVLLDRDAITDGAAAAGDPVRVLRPRARLLLLHASSSNARTGWRAPAATSTSRKPPARRSCSRPRTGCSGCSSQIPLTDNERAAVEGDQAAVDRLLNSSRRSQLQTSHRAKRTAGTAMLDERVITHTMSPPTSNAAQRVCLRPPAAGDGVAPATGRTSMPSSLRGRAARSSWAHTRSRSSSPNRMRCSIHARRPATVRNICSSRSGRAKRRGRGRIGNVRHGRRLRTDRTAHPPEHGHAPGLRFRSGPGSHPARGGSRCRRSHPSR